MIDFKEKQMFKFNANVKKTHLIKNYIIKLIKVIASSIMNEL